MAKSTDFDNYVDLLDELRLHNDTVYAMKSKRFPVYHGPYALSNHRTPRQLLEDTLASRRVRSAIDSVSIERGWTRQATEKAARSILTEMAQNFDMKSVRPLAYVAKKIIPRLFSHVYVNRERFLSLKKLSEQSSIIFMPSHRTYMDFILMQFLCFHYELNLPAIAAAADFLNMKFMGEALRRCGAFFIRRKFGDDKLYWAIFTEYVENQLKHADRPMEFFIEGTRSRTGKSLHPKFGLLSVLLSPYFRNEIYDFHIVPVSVSFGRILEESLYAYELLGFPKPKESTSGLWKARSVLNMDFGDVFVHFAEPISVRDFFTKVERPQINPSLTMELKQDGINRSVHALKPIFLFEYTQEEQREIRRFAHRIVKINERNAVVRLWSLACIVISKMYRKPASRYDALEFSYPEFLENLDGFFDLVTRLKHQISLTKGNLKDEVDYFLKLHSNIIDFNGDRLCLKPVAVSVIETDSAMIPGTLINAAIPRLMIANYANQAMHLFSNLSFVCLSILKNGSPCHRNMAFDDFLFLQALFSREFIAVPGEERACFDEAVNRLSVAGLLTLDGNILSIPDGIWSKIEELASVIEIFLYGHAICMDVLLSVNPEKMDEKHFAIMLRKWVSEMLQNGKTSMIELLSGDLIKNSLHGLFELNAVKKVHSNIYVPVIREIHLIRKRLGSFLEAFDNSQIVLTGNYIRKSKL